MTARTLRSQFGDVHWTSGSLTQTVVELAAEIVPEKGLKNSESQK